MTAPDFDPFGDADKSPAISFKDAPVGTVVTLVVTDVPRMVQSRDFKTKEPATWPDGNPKMAAVINGTVDGEPRSLWASKPSAMFGAIAQAQREAGKRIAPGDTIAVKFTGTKPTSGDPQKLYAAKLTPGAPKPPADVFGGDDSQPPW